MNEIPGETAENGRSSGSAAVLAVTCDLFCLPYAGGDSTAFWKWRDYLPEAIRLQFIELPGRGLRVADSTGISAREVAKVIAAEARGPYAIYGHSMGARLAFEATRELRRLGVPPPLSLYVGAAHPPHLPEPLARLAHVTEDDFIEQLILRAGAPAELREHPEVRAAVMPAIRADLGWLKRYRYHHEPPLTTPVVAFAGAGDPEVDGQVMLGWSRHTTGRFRLHVLDGDHMFLTGAVAELTALLAADLASAASSAHANGTDAAVEADAVHSAAGGARTATRSTLPLPAADEVHVWLASLDRLRPAGTDAASAELRGSDGFAAGSDGEGAPELPARVVARAAAIGEQRARHRYLARRAVLRRILRRYGGPAALAARPRVSHSGGTALLALSRDGVVGVDIAELRPWADLPAECDRVLSPAEWAVVAAEPEQEQQRAALRLLTAQRALRKAFGGRRPPARLSFAAAAGDEGSAWWRPDPGPEPSGLAEWRVTHLEVGGVVAALAVPGGARRVRFETVVAAPR